MTDIQKTMLVVIVSCAILILAIGVNYGTSSILEDRLRLEIKDTQDSLERRLNRMQTELNALLQWKDTANVYLPFTSQSNREKVAEGIEINHEMSR